MDAVHSYVPIEYCEGLTGPSIYAKQNQDIGLPEQSVALASIAEATSEDTDVVLAHIDHYATFLLFDNYFLTRLDYFLMYWDATQGLNQSLNQLAPQILPGQEHFMAVAKVTHLLATIARNPRLFSESSFFGQATLLLRVMACAHFEVPLDFLDLLLVNCTGIEQFNSLIGALETSHSAQEFAQSAQADSPQISTLGLKILDGCTRQCAICYEDPSARRSDWNLLSVDDLWAIDDVLANVGSVDINGGEPLEHPDIIAICRHLAHRRVPFNITSTGADVELLEQLLPFYRGGNAFSFTLSMHHHHGERGRRFGAQTAAFWVRHNIPIKVNCTLFDLETTIDSVAYPLIDDLRRLGVPHVISGIDPREGDLSQQFFSSNVIPRDPLITLFFSPAVPSGKCLNHPGALANSESERRNLRQSGARFSDLCQFRNPVIRADRTVAPCASCFVGGKTPVQPVLDHLPTSMEELSAAMDDYRARILDRVHRLADEKREFPCFVHRELNG